ncbi:MAG: hypothetical protein JWN02_1734 [Acidobacteria bacterium]|nr:hypothetical protein [Acidobacteriota bacterium]
MLSPLTFTLKLLFNQAVADAVGTWEYAAATGVESGSNTEVQLMAHKRAFANYTSAAFSASMLTATILFPTTSNDGVADNLTIQGIHSLSNNNETGSVSSASPLYAAYIGGNFTFAAGLLTINPPA